MAIPNMICDSCLKSFYCNDIDLEYIDDDPYVECPSCYVMVKLRYTSVEDKWKEPEESKTPEKDELYAVARPLIDWIQENCDKYTEVAIGYNCITVREKGRIDIK